MEHRMECRTLLWQRSKYRHFLDERDNHDVTRQVDLRVNLLVQYGWMDERQGVVSFQPFSCDMHELLSHSCALNELNQDLCRLRDLYHRHHHRRSSPCCDQIMDGGGVIEFAQHYNNNTAFISSMMVDNDVYDGMKMKCMEEEGLRWWRGGKKTRVNPILI